MTRHRGFTLLELLVVIMIIGLIMAITVPALNGARQRANQAACGANLHGLGIGLRAYLDMNNQRMPNCGSVPSINTSRVSPTVALASEVTNPKAWRCPADKLGYLQIASGKSFDSWFAGEGLSYEFNMNLSDKRPEQWWMYKILGDHGTWLFKDFDSFHGPEGKPKSMNVLFQDSHVGTIQDIKDITGDPAAVSQPSTQP